MTHIGSQFQQHLDGMALSPSGRSMERGVVLLVLHIHISSATNKAVDAVSVSWEGRGGGEDVCVCVCVYICSCTCACTCMYMSKCVCVVSCLATQVFIGNLPAMGIKGVGHHKVGQ